MRPIALGTESSALHATATLLVITAVAATGTGCATGVGSQPRDTTPAQRAPANMDDLGQRVQSLADRFIGREAQAYQDLEASSSNPKVRAWARTTKAGQALAAMSIATGPNPYENAVDLVVMITLKRASIEANEAQTLLSPLEAASLIEIYRRAETIAWELVERILTPAEVQGVKERSLSSFARTLTFATPDSSASRTWRAIVQRQSVRRAAAASCRSCSWTRWRNLTRRRASCGRRGCSSSARPTWFIACRLSSSGRRIRWPPT
jgi:hypothetical protein